MNDRTFEAFAAEVRALLDDVADGKGYASAGPDGPNLLYEFVRDTVGGPGHAAGEMIYKVRRYMAKRDPVDLQKAAAWAFLAWRFHGPAQE